MPPMSETRVGSVDELGPGSVTGVSSWAVVNVDGKRYAVSRHCRHLRADLADGTIDADGCLVCPWHHSAYDVTTGRMVVGPQGAFAKVPGLGAFFKALTRVVPLGRAKVVERDGEVYVRE
jgi:nitrite reductase/ring-hydroxylating ferredoxin subunit